MPRNFSHYKQVDSKDCGPTCLKIIAKYYGKTLQIQSLRDFSETTRSGSNLLLLSDAAEKIGFKTLGVKLSLNRLDEVSLPCILHRNKNHYVVLYKIKKGKYYISDPALRSVLMKSTANVSCLCGIFIYLLVWFCTAPNTILL